MQELRSKLQNPRSFKSKTDSTKMNRREIRSELKAIKKEAIVREKAVVERLIRNASIVFATCVGTSSHLLKDLQFDLVVVDEAAQALEAACWIPIMKSSKCVLAGDHCQLPPTIKSKSAEEGGLNMTLFEKIIKDNRFANIVKLLNVQYRMNDVISRWASKNMYNNHVLSATSVMNHTIFDLLPNSNRNDCGEDPENAVMLMIDTSDCYMFEDSSDGTSHRNINEADIVLQHVVYLLQSGIRPSDIGVITPYNGQLELLRDLFMTTANGDPDGTMKAIHSNILPQLAGVDIKTIDGFQGGEKECIIISLVRSNESHTVGFLGENRRINVAVTRAKRQVTIVCDSSTCSTNSFIKTLIDHIEEQGAVIPADVYMDQHAHVQTKVVTETVAKAKEKGKSKENSKKKIFSAISNKTSSSKKFASDQPAVQIANNTNIQNSKSSVSDELCSKIKELLEDYAVDKIGNGIIDKELTRGLRSQEGANSLIFPASLSSFHRLHVHQVAEELGLVHISTGEGIDRRISVSKRVSSPNKQDMSKQKLGKWI
jgi:ATP-dependent RNA/DNA helicase IGHMBP2